ncbi:hypothetical protein S40285_05639 [Stachybotrys chlorohalonatus IBT 40285]|uniref:Uncharacterized protein n=1 Tax=Stachybotrys chlorohalonatus (strain IBT 40285) TaxID=1283841 RepID=A0A084QM27_STAC4|nr:hypothetical protein S40285_05639 [Stachybotrys chlorohalonata IBT 40285]
MTTAAVATAIGFGSSLLGIISFGSDAFASRREGQAASVVRIGVALDKSGGTSNAGGDLPRVRLWNAGGEFLGRNIDPGDIRDGESRDITVYHSGNNGQQAPYMLLSASDNAICIAYTTITWPDGGHYAWLGDWGDLCDKSWYHSNLYVPGTNHTPACTWIDRNRDKPHTGFQLHFPDFAGEKWEDEEAQRNHLCSGIPFGVHTEPNPESINIWSRKRDSNEETHGAIPEKDRLQIRQGRGSLRKRSRNMRRNTEFHNVVIDGSTRRTATHLCESEGSEGPDYANTIEGLFCRMSDKTLWPICSETIHDNCFNTDPAIQQLIINGLTTRDSPYSAVSYWGTNA